jgi:hypothetical protein
LSPERLEALAAADRLGDAILPIAGLLTLPRVQLGAVDADRFRHGSPIRVEPDSGPDGRMAVFDADQLLGVGTLRAGLLQPDKVLASQGAE